MRAPDPPSGCPLAWLLDQYRLAAQQPQAPTPPATRPDTDTPATAQRVDIDPERLAFSTAEAAKTLGIGRATIYELIRSGELSSVKIGSRRLIRRQALEDLLDRLEGS